MAHEPVPSLDLGPDHLHGLHIVGTVSLPSHPAGGRIFAVRYPAPKGGSPRYFVKIHQRHGDCHSVTHFVDVDHVRQVRFHAAPTAGAEKAAQPATMTGQELKDHVTKIDWAKHVKDDRATHEVEIRPNQTGTVHVPEAAPVIVRTEATVPAATARRWPRFPCPLLARRELTAIVLTAPVELVGSTRWVGKRRWETTATHVQVSRS